MSDIGFDAHDGSPKPGGAGTPPECAAQGMNGNTTPGLSGQEGIAAEPRVTARTYRARDETFTEYYVDGEVFHDVDQLEAALRGEIDA